MKKRKNKTALKPCLIVLACVLTIPLVFGLFSMGDGTNRPSGGGGGASTSGGVNNSTNTVDDNSNTDVDDKNSNVNSDNSNSEILEDNDDANLDFVENETDLVITHFLANSIDEAWIVSMQDKGKELSDGSRLFCETDDFSIKLRYFKNEPIIVVQDNKITYDYVNAVTASSLGLSQPGWIDSSIILITTPIGISMPEGTVLYLDDWSELDPLFE